MLFADFIKRLMPIAQSAPEFRDHFPPASWKQLFDLGTEAGDGLLVFEVDDLLLAELGGGRVEDVVVPFVRALNQEFAGDRARARREPRAERSGAIPRGRPSYQCVPSAERGRASDRPPAQAPPPGRSPSGDALPARPSRAGPGGPPGPSPNTITPGRHPVPNVEVSSVDDGTARAAGPIRASGSCSEWWSATTAAVQR